MAILGMNPKKFSRINLKKPWKEKVTSRGVLFIDIGWVSPRNNPEMISRVYEVWKSLATKIPEFILRRSIFRNDFNTTNQLWELIFNDSWTRFGTYPDFETITTFQHMSRFRNNLILRQLLEFISMSVFTHLPTYVTKQDFWYG